jgi:predicted acyl esterase
MPPLLAVRLCEVAPDGTSARVTFGLQRVRRPPQHAPGERFQLDMPLKGVAYRFSPGCRVRVALSSAYWPMAWSEPVGGGLTLWPAGAVMTLPAMPSSVTEFFWRNGALCMNVSFEAFEGEESVCKKIWDLQYRW